MRIIIDIQGIQNDSRERGIGRYTLALTRAILRQNTSHDIIILLSSLFPQTIENIQSDLSDLIDKNKILVCELPGPVNHNDESTKLFREVGQLLREAFIADLKPDRLVICSLFEGAYDNTISSVKILNRSVHTSVVMYDLIPLIYPNRFLADPDIKSWYFEKIDFLKRADLLLAISQSAADEAHKLLSIPEDRITTISTAVDPIFCVGSKKTEVVISTQTIEKMGISKPFIMHASAYEPRKNFEGLIEAYSQLPRNLIDTYQLVLVCRLKDDQKAALVAKAKKLNIPDGSMVLTGFLPDRQLIDLYSSCYLFVFPSHHEGFGLPALEAMSCGAATIGSATSSIPEVIGRKDALFDPYDTHSICDAIQKALTDKNYWRSLKVHALTQSKLFNWDETAKRALKALEQTEPTQEITTTQDLIEMIASYCDKYNASEKELILISTCFDYNQKRASFLNILLEKQGQLNLRIEGPFDSSYSLALLNRETALALNEIGHNVFLHSTEGPGDFDPNQLFLNQNPKISDMYNRSKETPAYKADIQSRNLYPPRVDDMEGTLKIMHHYAWEESGFPSEWASNFNYYLDGMTLLSNHVKKIMIDAGVAIPMTVSGCGVDHWEKITPSSPPIIERNGFRFLHVSSCFPRKGIDLLLGAYEASFTSKDDVTLIIKTFANPHNTVKEQLTELKTRNTNFPHVQIIEEDLSSESLKALYESCDVLVAPSLAEGFGLPIAEAMLSGLPVITTNWGGQLDFCNEQNSWLVDFSFERAKTHFNLFTSTWAVPDINDLSACMKKANLIGNAHLQKMASEGKSLLLKKFTWKEVTEKYLYFIKETYSKKRIDAPNIGWITTWNTPCGIADYSKHLISNDKNNLILAPITKYRISDDPKNCIRLWNQGKGSNRLNKLLEVIELYKIRVIILQFNYGLFNFKELSNFIKTLTDKGIKVLIMMHSTYDPYGDTPNWTLSELTISLKNVFRIMVHSIKDLNRLKSYGLVHNTMLWPHGVMDFNNNTDEQIYEDQSRLPMVMSFGFCLPHKGLIELIEAVAILKSRKQPVNLTLLNAEYPAEESRSLINAIKQKVIELELTEYITLDHEFHSDEVSIHKMTQADFLIFPYQNTGESSSAAVRYGITSGTPVLVTPLEIFEDLGDIVFRLNGIVPEAIANGVTNIIDMKKKNSEVFQQTSIKSKKWIEEHKYDKLKKRLHQIVTSSVQNQSTV